MNTKKELQWSLWVRLRLKSLITSGCLRLSLGSGVQLSGLINLLGLA